MSEVMETEATELIVLPPSETALQVYQQVNGLDPYIERIQLEVMAHEPDTTTAKGRAAIGSLAFKVRKAKTALDHMGKDLVDSLKDVPKKIDAERKRMRETLDALAEKVREPLTQWEQAEDARIDAHKVGIAWFIGFSEHLDGVDSATLKSSIAEVSARTVDESWEEFETEAHRAKDKALEALTVALVTREKYEADQAELAELRRKQAEQERKNHDERIARETAERVKREAEAKAQAERDAAAIREANAKAAQERAEREKLEAIERQKQAEAHAEAEKLAAEERVKQAAESARLAEVKRQADEAARIAAETKKREADRAHKGKVNRDAVAALVAGGLTQEAAKLAVVLIAKGSVPAVRINY